MICKLLLLCVINNTESFAGEENRMFRLITIFVLAPLFLLSKTATGEIFSDRPSMTDFYSFERPAGGAHICQESKSIGFVWRGGAWQSTDFKPATNVFKKLDHRLRENAKWRACNNDDGVTDSCYADWCMLNRCYQIKSIGGDAEGTPTRCMEHYEGPSSSRKLRTLHCGIGATERYHYSISIADGGYTGATGQGSPKPNSDGQNMWLSHGQCTGM